MTSRRVRADRSKQLRPLCANCVPALCDSAKLTSDLYGLARCQVPPKPKHVRPIGRPVRRKPARLRAGSILPREPLRQRLQGLRVLRLPAGWLARRGLGHVALTGEGGIGEMACRAGADAAGWMDGWHGHGRRLGVTKVSRGREKRVVS